MLSAADLTAMQATAQLTLVTACTIQRKTSTSDGGGGFTDSWTALSTPNCCIAPVPTRYEQTVTDSREELISRWLITLPAGQDIRIEDRIVANGITYEVLAYAAPRSFEIERTVEVAEVQLQ